MKLIHTKSVLTGILSLASLASLSPAQTALLREGDALVGAPAGHNVTSISSGGTNQAGGFAVQVNSSDGATTLSHAWGSATGALPGVLITEATYGTLVQTSFEGFLGVDDLGTPCYSASGTGGTGASFDSVWLGPTPIAVEGDPIPSIPGQFWRFGSRPGVTAGGVPYFVGGITSTSGGSTENRGLFLGLSPVSVLLGGDAVPGLPEILSTSSSVAFDYRFSAAATNYIAEVQMDSSGVLTTSNDGAMVLSGAGLMLGGALVQEGTLMPVSVGGDGTENWDNFDFTGITEAGEYFFSGDTDGATSSDEILVQNGNLRFREGDTVDGQVLTGALEGAFMNESGALAYIWDIDVAGTSTEALFFEDQLLLKVGDAVDWDGDGVIDPLVTITAFTGISALSLGSDTLIYFTADVDDAGATLEGYFCMAVPSVGTAYCFGDGSGTACPCGNPGAADGGCANGSDASGAKLEGSGSVSVSAGDLVLNGSRLAPGQPGLYFQGNNALSGGAGQVFGDGLRCTGGSVVRLQVVNADAAGVSASSIDIPAASGLAPGDVRRYQLWYRDPAGSPCGAFFNLSNGLEVVWQP